MTILNGLQKIFSGVINTIDELGESLSVGSPLDDDLIQVVVGLELTEKPSAPNKVKKLVEM